MLTKFAIRHLSRKIDKMKDSDKQLRSKGFINLIEYWLDADKDIVVTSKD